MELIKIFNSISINELYFVKSLLESEGIPAEVFDDTIGQIAPHYLFYQGGPRLMVRDVDQEHAQKIINQYLTDKNSPPISDADFNRGI
ncbi:MAG: DUF2007 domain-containing protein [Candidatus Omnitrophica bacterium]|nr:DUF2007 domain-containing protein [Candidatus Omnitrophota bacterium]